MPVGPESYSPPVEAPAKNPAIIAKAFNDLHVASIHSAADRNQHEPVRIRESGFRKLIIANLKIYADEPAIIQADPVSGPHGAMVCGSFPPACGELPLRIGISCISND